MATGGYVGKILYVNLTTGDMEEIPTADYEEWGGGHGMGSALFFDRVKDKTIDGYHPDNLVTMMTSPLSGTLVPSASGRTECNFIGIQQVPVGWYTRSNFGGRFAGELKFAGWDGIAIQGKSETPVWLNIVNGTVTIEDASGLWGLDTYETQEEIWSIVSGGNADDGTWYGLSTGRDGGRTTQRPAVATIGPAGEHLNRNACVLHDAGNAAGQGGLGGVLGSKNLKAVSVIGTGSIAIADPAALVDARMELQAAHGYDVDAPALEGPVPNFAFYGIIEGHPGFGPLILNVDQPARAQGCMGCFKNCRRRLSNGISNEDQCVESLWWVSGTSQLETNKATDLLDKAGLNVYDLINGHSYLNSLYQMGILGPGKAIESNLPWEKYGTYEFIEQFVDAIVNQTDIGADLADGVSRAAIKWGRWDEDTSSGLLNRPQWGYQQHYEPRLEVEWSYGSLFGDRDINEHGINWHVHWHATVTGMIGQAPLISAEDMVNLIAEGTGVGDPMGWNYSPDGIYTEAKAKAIAWHRHYTRFWKQSIGYCDWAWPMFINYNNRDGDFTGMSPGFEPRFFNAVTGKNITWQDGLELGRKIWNLDRAIWVLQGRHRDLEVYTNYVYDTPTEAPDALPMYLDGEWKYDPGLGRSLDREKFEGFKTTFYTVEGWDTATGWPTRATLDELGLGKVADELAAADKLGA